MDSKEKKCLLRPLNRNSNPIIDFDAFLIFFERFFPWYFVFESLFLIK